MLVLCLEALAAIAVTLSVLMAIAWAVRQRTGNSGWVDTIRTFVLGLVGAGSALWPVGGAATNARQWLVAALVATRSPRLGSQIAARTAKISHDPRFVACAKERGVDSPRRMFILLQNQGFGSIRRRFPFLSHRGFRLPRCASRFYLWGWATLPAPLFMYWILVHVTGIPPLEAQMLRSRGERYRDYQTLTSMFFPLPPQKGAI